MKEMKIKIVKWLISKWLPEYHLRRNPIFRDKYATGDMV